jgi:hypothetical protein
MRRSNGLVPLEAGGRPDKGFLEQPHHNLNLIYLINFYNRP